MIDAPTVKAAPTVANPDGRAMRRMERQARARIHAALQKWGRALFRGVTADTVALITARLDNPEYSKLLRDTMISVLQDVADAGAEFGRRQVEQAYFGVKAVDPLDVIDDAAAAASSPGYVVGVVDWTAANADAAQWAIDYGYSLIRGITDTTRAQVAREIRYFVDNSLTINQLRDRLLNSHLFSLSRAEAIAITEVTRSYQQGALASWRASRVVRAKQVNTAVDEAVCPICAPKNKMIFRLDDPRGDPPFHPRCRCWGTPISIGDDDEITGV